MKLSQEEQQCQRCCCMQEPLARPPDALLTLLPGCRSSSQRGTAGGVAVQAACAAGDTRLWENIFWI